MILIALFAVQSRGTGAVSIAFGPITLVWFAALAAAGIAHIADDPRIFAALNPLNAVTFLVHGGFSALIVLGAVFLTVTGAEALLRRSRTFRPQADTARLAGGGLSGSDAELSRTGRLCAERCRAPLRIPSI